MPYCHIPRFCTAVNDLLHILRGCQSQTVNTFSDQSQHWKTSLDRVPTPDGKHGKTSVGARHFLLLIGQESRAKFYENRH